jgi:polysaccharide biosynthesis transport protein
MRQNPTRLVASERRPEIHAYNGLDRRPPQSETFGAARPEREVPLADHVKVLYKRRWLALTAFFVVFVSAAVMTLTETPVYEAKVQLLIEKENSNVVSFKEAFEQNQVADDYYQTQYRILQSRALARRALDLLGVTATEVPKAGGRRSIRASLRDATVWVQTRIFGVAPSSPPAAPGENAVQSARIDALLGGLTVAPIRTSRLVDVRYASPDPALATRVANAWAKAYIQQNLEFKFSASKDASDWLSQRLGEQRKQVEASEQALQQYRETSDAVSLEERQNIVVQKLADLNSAVTRAKTERFQKETAYNQIRSIQKDRSSLDTFPAVLANGFIQQQKSEVADLQRQQSLLSEKLGPNHPDMLKVANAIHAAEAKLQGEIGKIVQAVKNEYEAAVSQERNLVAALEQQKMEALALNRKGIQYAVLQRDASSNRQIFDTLMQRSKETGISGELKMSNIRVVDPAEVPSQPVSPNVRTELQFAAGGGLLFAIVICFVFDHLDNRIKTPDELKDHLGLPYFGMVPAMFEKSNQTMLISNGAPSGFVEAIRALRSNLLFSSSAAESRSLVVTSTAPGEGKTLVAANLAVALAQAGHRVLLIDGDMRRPRVHQVFDIPQEPGLSNVIAGTAKASESVKPSSVPGLWLMPAGAEAPNPSELLGSKRFNDFADSLSENFEWVIIDTPPLMAVTDSAIIAHGSTGVLFVVGAEMTSRFAARRALEQLHHAKAQVVGAVLNRVDLKHHSYYYSDYYRREYATYYQSSPAQ